MFSGPADLVAALKSHAAPAHPYHKVVNQECQPHQQITPDNGSAVLSLHRHSMQTAQLCVAAAAAPATSPASDGLVERHILRPRYMALRAHAQGSSSR